MALTVNNLASNADTSNVTGYTTGAFTPTAGALLIACFDASRASADVTLPTISDTAGLTWTQIADNNYLNTTGTARGRMTIFAARAGGSPSSMTVSGTWTGACTGIRWSVFEVLGSDVANGVAQAIVQTVNSTANAGSATSVTLTLAAAGNANNRAFLWVGHGANESYTIAANWAEIGSGAHASPNSASSAQWRAGAFDTAPSTSWASSQPYGMTAWEIKAATASNYTLTAVKGSFSLTGQAAVLKKGSRITSAKGSFALTGRAAGLNRGYRMDVAGTNMRFPHGIYIMDDPVDLGLTWVDGLRKQIFWNETQLDEVPNYDWSIPDAARDAANAAGKQVGFSLALNGINKDDNGLPYFVRSAVTLYNWTKDSGKSFYFALPWDPVYLAKVKLFIAAFCQRYDGQCDYILAGGIGYGLGEWTIPLPSDTDPNYPGTIAANATSWVDSTNQLLDTYYANTRITPFVASVVVPFRHLEGAPAVNSVISRAAMYGKHFGVMGWALNALSSYSKGFLPDQIVSDLSATNVAGHQFSGSSTGIGGDIKGTVAQVLTAGVGLGDQWIEMYAVDGINPANETDIEAAAAALSPSPESSQSGFTVTGRAIDMFVEQKLSADGGALSLTGGSVGLRRGARLNAGTGALALTGRPANLLRGRKITSANGSFALSGQAASLKRGLRITASTGAYGLTGRAANLLLAHLMTATRGAFVLTGQPIQIRIPGRLSASAGSFLLTGQTVGLRAGHALAMTRGSYALNGMATNLLRNHKLTLAPGAFTLTGRSAALIAARTLTMARGSYVFTGEPIVLKKGYKLAAQPGAYSLTGNAIVFSQVRVIILGAGAFALTGRTANLAHNRRLDLSDGNFVLTGEDLAMRRGYLIAAEPGLFELSGGTLDFGLGGMASMISLGGVAIITALEQGGSAQTSISLGASVVLSVTGETEQ